jgi:hypothetical protein
LRLDLDEKVQQRFQSAACFTAGVLVISADLATHLLHLAQNLIRAA